MQRARVEAPRVFPPRSSSSSSSRRVSLKRRQTWRKYRKRGQCYIFSDVCNVQNVHTWLCAHSCSSPTRAHAHTYRISTVMCGCCRGSSGLGEQGRAGGEGSAGEEPCRGAHNRLINGPRVTAIKVACQRHRGESQRRFSAMIEEPSFSAALSTAEHSKVSLLLFKGTSPPLFLPHPIPAAASPLTAAHKEPP